jgi:hypothetical protein
MALNMGTKTPLSPMVFHHPIFTGHKILERHFVPEFWMMENGLQNILSCQ